MDYTAKALQALGKALSDRDMTINTLKWENDSLRKQVVELEAQLISTENNALDGGVANGAPT